MKRVSRRPKRATQPKVVTIGGGSGQSRLLWYLKSYPLALTAVVSMVDNGGSTGKLREQLGVLPPGDVRRCLVALAKNQSAARELFEYRFTEGDLAEHTVGNLILAGLTLKYNNFYKAVQKVSQWLDVQGCVVPVSLESSHLYARLANGKIIQGETNIDLPQHDVSLPIEKLYLQPKIRAAAPALMALRSADYIILTIGDLFTSVLPNLLVSGVAEALQTSRAKIIYTCNRTTKLGETRGFDVLQYVRTIEQYLGRSLDGVVVDKTVNTDRTTKHLVKYSAATLRQHGLTVYEANLRSTASANEIDGKKLAAIVAKVCQPS